MRKNNNKQTNKQTNKREGEKKGNELIKSRTELFFKSVSGASRGCCVLKFRLETARQVAIKPSARRRTIPTTAISTPLQCNHATSRFTPGTK